MSLFQVNEWWKCSLTETEECGAGCLCVANIDNSDDNLDKIILGSYTGFLHIYLPTKELAGLHDCLLETNLQLPILQIKAGRFMPVNKDVYLAVLHPRLLCIYEFTRTVGKQEDEMKMENIYQHKLERSAANMICGPFGGVRDRDFLCVQSLDGALSVFEQETFAFTRFIPNFLLPGPLAYAAHSDSILTVSSSYILEAYSYQVLAVASDVKTDENKAGVGGKKIETDWTCNLGEYAMEIEVVEFPENHKPLIVVFGEHSLFCVDITGKLEFVKKFEDTLSCVKSFPSPQGNSLITIACTHTKQLLVFEGAVTKWAAKLDDVPVVVQTGNFCGFDGMMVMATDECQISCQYLGTSPSMLTLPRSKQRDMTHDRVDKELRQTKKLIAEHLAVSGDQLRQKKPKKDLEVSLKIPKTLDKRSVASQASGAIVSEMPSFTIQIILKVNCRINDVQVSIPVHKPLCSTISNSCFSFIMDQDHPPGIRASFFLEDRLPPSSLNHKLLVYYKQINGIPQVKTTEFRLPLTLVATPSAPVKKLDHKMTLDSNRACLNLMELFPDFSADHSGPNCIGFSYMNGVKGTILTSKSSNRYRIQCEEYYGLWLLTDELIYRLRKRNPDTDVSSQDSPGLEEYVPIIDEHFQLRRAASEMRVLLQQRAHQYRTIQRRLLTRFKDKTPQSLNGLDSLLLGTHTQILALADAIEDNDALLRQCCVRLSSATRLLVLLPSLWRQQSTEEQNQLQSALAADMTYNETSAVGWEEMVDTSITALLKTTLSRGDGGQTYTTATSELEVPQDTVKLKKHIAILMDRLSKGAKLTVEKDLSSMHNVADVTKDTDTINESLPNGYDDDLTNVPERSSPFPSSSPLKAATKLPREPVFVDKEGDLDDPVINSSKFPSSFVETDHNLDENVIESSFFDENIDDILS